jgi:hypothetical protein
VQVLAYFAQQEDNIRHLSEVIDRITISITIAINRDVLPTPAA